MFQRTIIVLFLITSISLLLLPASQTGAEQAGPVLVIPSPRHDAGDHWEGESVTHTFEMKNTGSAELKIFGVKPG